MYYSAIGILALLVLLIENQDILFKRAKTFKRASWRAYKDFLLAVILYYTTDILWGILESYKLVTPLMIDTSVYFVAMAIGVFCWTKYIVTCLDEKSRFGRFLLYFGRFLSAAVTVIVLINIFVPILFKVDSACVYRALPLRYIIISLQIMILLTLSGYTLTALVRRRTQERRKYRTLTLFGLIMAAFLVAQLYFPYLPLYSIAYLLGTGLLHSFVFAEEKESYRRELEEATKIAELMQENERAKAAYREALDTSAVYENIATMLSRDYFDLYYVNLETNEYIEYGSKTQEGERLVENRGENFFEATKQDARKIVFKEDLPKLLEVLDKETLLSTIDQEGIFRYYYRLMIDGEPTFVSMKVTRVIGDNTHIILGVTNVDAQMKGRMEAEQAKEERRAYLRLSAFSRNLLVLYVLDPESDEYTEFNSSEDFDELGIAKKGDHFFEETFQNAAKAVYEEDRDWFFSQFTKEKILTSVKMDGVFVLDYRLLLQGTPTYVRLKATEVEEDGNIRLVIGLENVDAYVRREQKQAYDLSVAREMAIKDGLTGVKNIYAFEQEKQYLSKQIQEKKDAAFALVVCDINGLKDVNDTLGHQAGDRYICKACNTICNIFRHSPVFRIGGDEFSVICQGNDYEQLDALLAQMDETNRKNNLADDVQIAYGAARFEAGMDVEEVFQQADERMYAHKAALKA